jgi:hypothetical protein
MVDAMESEDAPKSKSDRAFLVSTIEGLRRAKVEFTALFADSNSEKRAELLKRHQNSLREKELRRVSAEHSTARPKTADGGLLSAATFRQMQRKQQESRPVTAPSTASPARGGTDKAMRAGSDGESTTGGDEQMSPPRHTDFLKRRAGSTSSGRHSTRSSAAETTPAPTTVGSPRHRKKKTDGVRETKIPVPRR